MDIIEVNGLAEDAVLVTSDATQESIRKRITFLGTKLLWKMEVGTVPVLGRCENMLPSVGLKAFPVQPPMEYSNRG